MNSGTERKAVPYVRAQSGQDHAASGSRDLSMNSAGPSRRSAPIVVKPVATRSPKKKRSAEPTEGGYCQKCRTYFERLSTWFAHQAQCRGTD
ncbi:unnamed protein product, partial [Mesorhabditis spiculigera]